MPRRIIAKIQGCVRGTQGGVQCLNRVGELLAVIINGGIIHRLVPPRTPINTPESSAAR